MQLPEDTALSQAAPAQAPAQNPLAPVTTPDTENVPQNSATTTPATRPPTVGGNPSTSNPPRPGFIMYLIHHVWEDPHMRICKF